MKLWFDMLTSKKSFKNPGFRFAKRRQHGTAPKEAWSRRVATRSANVMDPFMIAANFTLVICTEFLTKNSSCTFGVSFHQVLFSMLHQILHIFLTSVTVGMSRKGVGTYSAKHFT